MVNVTYEWYGDLEGRTGSPKVKSKGSGLRLEAVITVTPFIGYVI